MRILFILLLLLTCHAQAWMEQWMPPFNASPVKIRPLPMKSVNYFVGRVQGKDDAELYAQYSKGGALDLNGDGVEDIVFIIPWMGCGLNANGYTVYFIVSDGANWRTENVLEGFGVDWSDFVRVGKKIYFRHSDFFGPFEKSRHNHWVYQMFTFDKRGVMKCANEDFGTKYPAVTIFYDNPKFRQIKLTVADRKKISEHTELDSHKYAP